MISFLIIFASFVFFQNVASASSDASLFPTSLCAGANFGCVVLNSTVVKCYGVKTGWGLSKSNEDYFGGSMDEVGDNLPSINIGTKSFVNQVVCGDNHVCFRLDSGELKCLGNNFANQVGIGSLRWMIGAVSGYIGKKLPMVKLGEGLKVLEIALGALHTCTLLTGNKVKCYGDNWNGELGLGNKDSKGGILLQMGDNLPFIDFGVKVEVASIHSGSSSFHNCVILSAPAPSSQKVKCWGLNDKYQLGYGDTNSRGDEPYEMGDNLTLVDLGTESKAKQIAIGGEHSCILLINNKLKCFGSGYYGQLASGLNSTISLTGNGLPSVLIDSEKSIKFVSAGLYHTCVVFDDMLTLKCVGYNDYGQLCQGDTLQRGHTPTTLFPNFTAIDLGTRPLTIKSIYSGSMSNCVVFVDSSVKCFGANQSGELLIGSKEYQIGDEPNEMGDNLSFTMFTNKFVPTLSPSPAPSCDYPTKKDCKKDKGCFWKIVGMEQKCTVFSCSTLKTKKSCMADKRCAWDASGCAPK